jgi:hypothetical protein
MNRCLEHGEESREFMAIYGHFGLDMIFKVTRTTGIGTVTLCTVHEKTQKSCQELETTPHTINIAMATFSAQRG